MKALERARLVRTVYANAHGSFELIQALGNRIPVIRLPDGREIDWPFTEADVRRALLTTSQ